MSDMSQKECGSHGCEREKKEKREKERSVIK